MSNQAIFSSKTKKSGKMEKLGQLETWQTSFNLSSQSKLWNDPINFRCDWKSYSPAPNSGGDSVKISHSHNQTH